MGSLGRAVYTLGKLIRHTGQAMDRLGSTFQAGYFIQEHGK